MVLAECSDILHSPSGSAFIRQRRFLFLYTTALVFEKDSAILAFVHVTLRVVLHEKVTTTGQGLHTSPRRNKGGKCDEATSPTNPRGSVLATSLYYLRSNTALMHRPCLGRTT